MSLGYRNCVGVDCNGSRGGLWAAWDDCQHITSVGAADRYLLLHIFDVVMGDWYLFLVYGHPALSERMKFWQELGQKIQGCARPVALIGDFNQVRSVEDKWSPKFTTIRGESSFNDLIFENRLIDLPNQGVWYTWCNNCSDSNIIYERLDRVLVSSDWFEKFPNASLMVLPIQRSDHSPLVFDTDMVVQPKRRIKCFEAIWLMDDTLKHIVPRAWHVLTSGSSQFAVCRKQNIVFNHLRNWSRLSYRSLQGQINETRQLL
ncbi:uncharacterized protein LOC114318684 [Camellia sinensis]|uniref:uncharacterized protein LOC114318684 n=1 Tax=Camellia sinensis TaxID=4442 RepID=UPI001035C642|nr:uncharacterized protein LOC114318684 [Camellia sinensis]